MDLKKMEKMFIFCTGLEKNGKNVHILQWIWKKWKKCSYFAMDWKKMEKMFIFCTGLEKNGKNLYILHWIWNWNWMKTLNGFLNKVDATVWGRNDPFDWPVSSRLSDWDEAEWGCCSVRLWPASPSKCEFPFDFVNPSELLLNKKIKNNMKHKTTKHVKNTNEYTQSINQAIERVNTEKEQDQSINQSVNQADQRKLPCNAINQSIDHSTDWSREILWREYCLT